MKTKADVEALLNNTKALSDRVDARLQEIENANIARVVSGGHVSQGGSDERRALAFYGVSHVKDLIKVNTCDTQKYGNVPLEVRMSVIQLKRAVDTARFISQRFHGQAKDTFTDSSEDMQGVSRVKGMLDHKFGKNELAPRLKAFGSTVSGGGDEWVPTLISSQYSSEYELELALETRFKEMQMQSNPWQFPYIDQGGSTKARKIAENTTATGTNFTTKSLTFTASKLVEFYPLPEELNEDSAVDFMPVARDEVVKAQLRAVEAAIINGDDDGTHIDSDTQAAGADVAEKAWKGLRRQALANSANGGTTDFSGAAVTTSNLRAMRAKMKRFGVNPLQCIWICGPAIYSELQDLDRVSTLEKFGPMATVIKGTLGVYQGIPIYVSQYMREDQNATGVYDSITTTRGSLLLVNVERWIVGLRRPIRTKIMEDLPQTDRWLLASYQRKDFQGYPQGANEVSVSYGYNIAV